VRSFISFDPPDDVREAIISVQNELKHADADVSWEQPRQLHSTVKFLGEISEDLLPKILSELRSILSSFQQMQISYDGIGGFPNLRQPRVLWIGCTSDDGHLIRMKDEIDRRFVPLGFAIEDRTFHPHVTLGRVRSPRNLHHLTPMLEKCTFERQRVELTRLFVMKSILQPRGAVYSVIDTIHLAT